MAVTVAIATMMNYFQDGVTELSNEMIGNVTEKALSCATRILRQTSAEFEIDSEVGFRRQCLSLISCDTAICCYRIVGCLTTVPRCECKGRRRSRQGTQ